MYVCMCFYYGLFTTGVKAPVPEGTTDWRCACKGVPDMHLAFVLTKFSQFRDKKLNTCTLFECQCIQHESTHWGHYFLRLLLETEPPFYVVIRATRRSSRLHYKGSTFISQVRPRESNPRPPALRSHALPTELTLQELMHLFHYILILS